MEPIRVLHVVTNMGRGGLETMIMNYYRNIDRSKVQFDFLVHRYEEADYDNEIISMGGKIYHLPKLNPLNPKYIYELNNFFKIHKEYRIVHSHINCLSSIILKYAKKNNIKVTIAHSHIVDKSKSFKHYIKLIYKKDINKYSDYAFACAEEAGKWLYLNRKFIVINNAIDINRYIFNIEKRNYVRDELNISNKLVIGHVGRFDEQKNHKFIIEVFNNIHKKYEDSVLLLVGDGKLRTKIEEKVSDLNLSDSVKFLGIRNDVNDLMQAMDIFLFPSLFEGLPVTIVEAQASGLKCYISDTIDKNSILLSETEVISLNESSKSWSDKILTSYENKRIDISNNEKLSNFDIKHNAKELCEFYQNIIVES